MKTSPVRRTQPVQVRSFTTSRRFSLSLRGLVKSRTTTEYPRKKNHPGRRNGSQRNLPQPGDLTPAEVVNRLPRVSRTRSPLRSPFLKRGQENGLPVEDKSFKRPRDSMHSDGVIPSPTDAIHPAERGDKSAFHIYLREIGQIPLLKQEEENELARRVQQGDDEAREMMIKANLRLVVKIARDFEGLGVPLLDLINEGNIGLMRAVERFDPGKGAKLSTYSALWIKQAIKRALANQGRDIRLPVHIHEKLILIQEWRIKLEEKLGHSPSPEELSAATGLPSRKIAMWLDASKCPASLNARVSETEGVNELGNAIPDEKAQTPYEEIEQGVTRQWLSRFIQELKPREWQVLNWRFGLDGEPGQTLDEIGQQLGLTREAVRQIQNRSLEKLRNKFKHLDQFPVLKVA